MEIAELILEFLSVLIYPPLILTISIFFRKELRELLSGKLTAKYKDLTLTIEKQKEELEVAEDKVELAIKTIEQVKNVQSLEASKNDTLNDYLQNTINLLELNANEYRLIEILQNEGDSGLDKIRLIEKLTDPRMDMHTFYKYKYGIEDTIDALAKKGILVVDNGRVQFSHKLLKEVEYR